VVEDFGISVRRARLAHRWSQRDLGQHVGMSQRAVSTWERGTAEPDDAVKERLREVLGLRDPAADGARRPASGERDYPGRTRLSELPFEMLEPSEFEDFTADLLAALYPEGHAYRVGASGHTQHGYDVLVEQGGQLVLGAQCKRVQTFGPADVDRAVRAAKTRVDQSILILSRRATPDARTALRSRAGWMLWDRNDLSRKLRGLSLDRSVPIMRHYFPRLLSDFLGVPRLGPWLEPQEYVRRMQKGAVYTHRWRLVGRTAALEDLVSFATDETGRVRLLVGGGGTGKTKILTTLCEILAHADEVAVRVLDRNPDTSRDAFEQLPREGKLLVVIDDAHDTTTSVGKILAAVRDVNPAANVLLALRPYGLAYSRRELALAGIHASEAPVIEVGDLTFDDASNLAREALNVSSSRFAARLAAAARDCPLLIVTGAALINRGDLDPHSFEGDVRLRTELTDRLADALTVEPTTDPARNRDLLCALAAFQPAHLADPDVRAAMEKLTGMSFSEVVPHLSALEEAGVLLRYGDAVRVVPDLLGDALLVRAARHHGSGLPSGYLDLAVQAAEGNALRNLVVNAGRIDWQESTTGSTTDGLIEPVWAQVSAAVHHELASVRLDAMEVLEKVAYFQPRRTLELAASVLSETAAPVTTEIGLGMTRTYTDVDVHHALAPVLRAVAYNLEFLPRAADLLWHLARDDERPTNQHPDHPLRLLHELAGFTREGPTEHQRVLAAQVERWLSRVAEIATVHAPLAVLLPLLATEGHDELWRPDALAFHPYILRPTPEILQLRSTVLDLTFSELASARLERASAAVTMLGAAVSLPQGSFGLKVPVEVQLQWINHLIDVLHRLRRYFDSRTLAPTILVAIRRQLQWLAENGPDGLRQAARDVLAAIPRTPANELARALHGGPIDPLDSPDYAARHSARERMFADVANVLASWSDDEIVTCIGALLGETRNTSDQDALRARDFLWNLVARRPSVGQALCVHALAAPDGVLVPHVFITLIALRQAVGGDVVALGRRLMESRSVAMARQVAFAFGIQRGQARMLDDEPDLLRVLASHEDRIVRAAALGAVRYIAMENKELAIDLLISAVPDGLGLEEFASVFGPPPIGSLAWPDLSAEQKNTFLRALVTYPSIDEYEIELFLTQLAHTEPLTVVELLEARVEAIEEERTPGYSPLPHHWQIAPPFREHDDFPELLRQVREWIGASPESAWRNYLGADVFAVVAGPFDAQVIDIIDEYLGAPDPSKMRVLASILRKADRSLVWDLDFVRRCLRAADRCGEQSLGAVQASLRAAISAGGRWGTPGQPFAEDVEQRHKAAELADSCIRGSVEEQFYRGLVESANRLIDWAVRDTARPPDDRAW
jgi:transcriptional regulator with XRE-family HTH domain